MNKPHTPQKKSIRKMRLVSIGALVVALSLLGMILLSLRLFTYLEQGVKEDMSFDIELPRDYDEESYQELSKEFRKIQGLRVTNYISADSALNYVRQEMGEDPSLILGYNPFSPRVQFYVYADYMHPDSLHRIQKQLEDLGLISEGLDTQQTEQLNLVERNMGVVQWALFVLLILQGVFAYVQMNNTTRLMIYAERLQIRTLTLIGATSWFIRRPIVLRSICDGVLAALISCLVLVGGLILLDVGGLAVWELLQVRDISCLIIVLLSVAVISTGLSSLRATWTYINMDGRRIHLI